MGLKDYRGKRNFDPTSEPRSSRRKRPDGGFVYVIQEHHASHLHYDLRLEDAGVLKSWAVPKVPSSKPGVRRLAVQTEDHPLGYEDFEGTIPEHEYGAGTVVTWDRGTYRPVERTADKWVVDIDGRRLRGRFALVRIKAKEGGAKTWLFFRIKEGGPKAAPSES
jgi:DNA ligase D-like protein (predicted 3'-phosphoesterase)